VLRRLFFATALAVLVAGCNSSNAVPPSVTATPIPTPSPTPTPAAQHLYVGSDNAAGQILQYNLPLTASSTANFGFASANNTAVGVDASGNLVAADNAGNLTYFPAPLSAGSVPTATFKNGSSTTNGQIAVTTAGDIFVTTQRAIVNGFTHPFTNSSTPSSTLTSAGMTGAIGAAFDTSGNLYVSSTPTTSGNLFVFAPPYTGAPIATPVLAGAGYRKIAVSSTQLFATSVAGTTGRVDVYALPITAASAPAFAITTGLNTPEGIALDAAGNLYVGNLSNATITVYTPPFSAASAPAVTLTVSTGVFAIFGITIGK
jgi:serine/threonine protein kinase, bacterial